MPTSVVNRSRIVVEALPPDVTATALLSDEDPLAAACLPHPAVIACVRGVATDRDVDAAEAWLVTRPEVQARAAMLVDLLAKDLASYGNEGLPAWVGASWSAIVRCPWGKGLDDAVARGESFFALV